MLVTDSMQNTDPYPMFEGRAEGDAHLLGDPQDDLVPMQEQQQHVDRGGDQMSNPGPSGAAEGHDGDPLSRELTPSESGEGESLHVSSLSLTSRQIEASAAYPSVTVQASIIAECMQLGIVPKLKRVMRPFVRLLLLKVYVEVLWYNPKYTSHCILEASQV